MDWAPERQLGDGRGAALPDTNAFWLSPGTPGRTKQKTCISELKQDNQIYIGVTGELSSEDLDTEEDQAPFIEALINSLESMRTRERAGPSTSRNTRATSSMIITDQMKRKEKRREIAICMEGTRAKKWRSKDEEQHARMMASRHLRRMMMERQWLRQIRCSAWLDQIEREGKSYDTYDNKEEERMSLKDLDRMRPDPEMDARG